MPNAYFETGTEVILRDKILFHFLMQQVFALQLHLETAEIKFAMQGPCRAHAPMPQTSMNPVY